MHELRSGALLLADLSIGAGNPHDRTALALDVAMTLHTLLYAFPFSVFVYV